MRSVNPYYWQTLLDSPYKLAHFYDIKADDKLLRGALGIDEGEVSGQAFDSLRKTYDLRREWWY